MRVTSSGFGTGAAREDELWADMGTSRLPSFDVLRLSLTRFPGQVATQLEASGTHVGEPGALRQALHDSLGLGAVTVGVRAYLFSADATDRVRREEPHWAGRLQQLAVPA